MACRILEEAASLSAGVTNPFVHRLELTTYDKIKVVLMTVTILPIRIVFMLLLLTSAWLLALFGLTGLSQEEMHERPMSGWRKQYLKPFICLVLRVMFLTGGWHWVNTKGKQASPKEAPILTLASHSSLFDVLPVVFMGAPSIVAKADAERIPFFGTLINYTQPVYVRREDPDSRQNTIGEICRRARSGAGWDQILIFPEGTCTNRSCLITFKPGAFYPGVPVQPVCIRYPNRLDTATWTWEGPGAMKLLWLTLCQFHNYCEIEYLPVYSPDEAEKLDPRLFADNVRRVMGKALGIPACLYSYDDLRYIRQAEGQNFPRTVPIIKLLKLRYKHKFRNVGLADDIRQLSRAVRGKRDEHACDLRQFADFLQVDVSDALRDFFVTVDQEKKGKIDARSYICGLWLVNENFSLEERLHHVFKVLGQNQHGQVELKEFVLILWFLLELPHGVALAVFRELSLGDKKYITLESFKRAFGNTSPLADCNGADTRKDANDDARAAAVPRVNEKDKSE